MKKWLSMLLSILLAVSLAVPVMGAAAEQASVRILKYLDGAQIQVDNTGMIQSVQLELLVDTPDLASISMTWDASLASAYKHYKLMKQDEKHTRIIFYVDSKNAIAAKNLTIGQLNYQGYNNGAEIVLFGKMKLLNTGIQLTEYELTAAQQQINTNKPVNSGGSSSGSTSQSGTDKKPDTDKKPEADQKPEADKDTGSSTDETVKFVPLKTNARKVSNTLLTIQLASSKAINGAVGLNLTNPELSQIAAQSGSKEIAVNVMLPDYVFSKKTTLKAINVPKNVVNTIIKKKKSVQFAVMKKDGKLVYAVTLNSENLKKATKDINIALTTAKAAKTSKIAKLSAGSKNMTLAFTQQSAFGGSIKVKFPASSCGFPAKSRLLLSRYNSDQKELTYVSKGIYVLSDGFAEVTLKQGGTYALSTEGWIRQKKQTKYYKNNQYQTGLITIKGSQYYFDKKTKNMAVSKKIVINGKTYRFDKNGKAI